MLATRARRLLEREHRQAARKELGGARQHGGRLLAQLLAALLRSSRQMSEHQARAVRCGATPPIPSPACSVISVRKRRLMLNGRMLSARGGVWRAAASRQNAASRANASPDDTSLRFGRGRCRRRLAVVDSLARCLLALLARTAVVDAVEEDEAEDEEEEEEAVVDVEDVEEDDNDNDDDDAVDSDTATSSRSRPLTKSVV